MGYFLKMQHDIFCAIKQFHKDKFGKGEILKAFS